MKRILAWQLIWLVPLLFALPLSLSWMRNEAIRVSLSPSGGPDPVFSTMGMGTLVPEVALLISCSVAFSLALLLSCKKQTRFAGLFILSCALGCFGGCVSRAFLFGDPRREAFTQLGERMMPLVHAIEAYHADHGAYPENLQDLVPKYLAKLPSTGMANYTNYTYCVGENARSYQGNPWIINIPAGYGMGFDQFYYFPLQNYPAAPYERMGKWAYFHE